MVRNSPKDLPSFHKTITSTKEQIMIEIERLNGPYGIPVLYQRMPDMVKSAAITWVVFTGAADDESVGKHGLYHWFEHVPFRGTMRYSGGYAATKGWATKYNGRVGAYTNMQSTVYHSFVPLSVWREALSVVTDLFAKPLVREDDVKAERDIIRQEIAGNLGQAERSAFMMNLPKVLFPGHPFGHPVVGTEETLDQMDAATLRKAYKAGYDRSRAVLFVIGNIPVSELMEELDDLKAILPDNGLSERRVPADRGTLPEWKAGEVTEIETQFASSVVLMLFPRAKPDPKTAFYDLNILSDLFQFGGLSSPLYRIVREERKLVYQTFCTGRYNQAMNHFGFCALAKKENVSAVLDAFRDVVRDESVRSKARLEEVQQGVRSMFEMRSIDPDDFKETALYRYVYAREIVNDSDYERTFSAVGIDQVQTQLDQLQPEKARIVIFKGMVK